MARSAGELAAELSVLLERKLGLRGGGLEAQVRRAGRLLPRRVRRAALEIAEAERREGNPRLARQTDPARVARAFAEVERHLKAVDPAARRTALVLGILGSIALGLLALFAAVVTVLVLRGLV
ncbi:MAG: hypothetical protein N2Z62_08375 [Rhodobacteraceae bacterium]|nr:hypothetical protein [Paracoccaceae bacterium]